MNERAYKRRTFCHWLHNTSATRYDAQSRQRVDGSLVSRSNGLLFRM